MELSKQNLTPLRRSNKITGLYRISSTLTRYRRQIQSIRVRDLTWARPQLPLLGTSATAIAAGLSLGGRHRRSRAIPPLPPGLGTFYHFPLGFHLNSSRIVLFLLKLNSNDSLHVFFFKILCYMEPNENKRQGCSTPFKDLTNPINEGK